MAKQQGRALLVQVDISGTFTNICALNARSFSINNEVIDVSSPDCTTPTGVVVFEGMYGVQTLSVEGTAIYNDTAGFNALLTASLAQTSPSMKITWPGFGTYAFSAHIEEITAEGDKSGALTSKLKLRASGTVTFTAE